MLLIIIRSLFLVNHDSISALLNCAPSNTVRTINALLHCAPSNTVSTISPGTFCLLKVKE